ncbi:MAG: hypothetical protein PWP23_1981 [Candidatus Sumerlaeota bacterium]|nr:hypothetical protein [Candidatus Sumerlaeota bacterium]
MWRRLYRRSRVYIPIILLLLVAMAVFLPLSPQWLARRAERELSAAVGVPVTIERLRVHLLAGEAALFGVEIGGGEERVRIETIRAEGAASELLAGDGFWPDRIIVSGVSDLEIARTAKGVEARGALASLLAELGAAEKEEKDDGAGLLARRLPVILVRGAGLRVNTALPGQPMLRFDLNTIRFASREGASPLVAASFEGLVTAGRTEEFHGQVRYFTKEQSVHAKAWLARVGGRLTIPGFGELEGSSNGLTLVVDGSRTESGAYAMQVDLQPERVEVAETRVGGERWTDSNLSVSASASLDADFSVLHGFQFRLAGDTADVRLEGDLLLDESLQTNARLRVARVPDAFYRIARREAAREGVRIESLTSDTLHLDVAASGPMLRPAEWDFDGTVSLRQIELRDPAWPVPLVLRRVNGNVTPDAVRLHTVEADFGDLILTGEAQLPMLLAEGSSGLASFSLALSGPGAALITLAKGKEIVPPEIRDASFPFDLVMKGSVPLNNREGVVAPDLDPEGVTYSGTLTWKDGGITLRDIPGDIHLSAGRIAFSETEATFSHLDAGWKDVTIEGDVAVHSEGPGWTKPPRYEVNAVAAGQVSSLLELAGHLVQLDVAPDFASGTMQARVQSTGTMGAWVESDYSVAASLQDGAMTLHVPHTLAIDRVFAEIEATPEKIELTRLSGWLEDMAQISGTGKAGTEEARLDFELQSPVAVAERVAPRDVEDLVMRGEASAKGVVRLVPRSPLPEAPGLAMRWIRALEESGPNPIGIREDAPILFDLQARIHPGKDAAVFHRDFPHALGNIRGDIDADAWGFTLKDVSTKWGDADNVVLNGRIVLGHFRQPLTIDCDVTAPELSINKWMNGWGSREWAARTYTGPRRERTPGEERQMAVIKARMKLGRTDFLSVRAQNATINLAFESWRGRRNTIDVTVEGAEVYGGSVQGDALVTLGNESEGELSHFRTELYGTNVQMKDFLTDLRKEPEELVGKFSGKAMFEGSIGDYSDWVGDGEFHVVESRFIGDQAFRRLSTMMNLGREKYETPTTIRGHAFMANEQIQFPDMVAENRDIRMVTAGSVLFNGDISFLVTVEVLTNRLDNMPVIGGFFDYVNAMKDRLVSLRVTGKIREPIIETTTLSSGELVPMQQGMEMLKQKTGSALRSGEKAIERGVKTLPGTSSLPLGKKKEQN